MTKFSIALVFFALAGQSSAQVLWQNAEAGDTTEVLKSKFSEAKTYEAPKAYSDGRIAELYIDQREIGGEVLDVVFVMKDGRLDLVHLLMAEDATGKRPNSVHFETIEALLARRYGQPVYQMPAAMTDPRFLRLHKNEFREGDLTVSLNCMFCGSKDASLNIYYELGSAEDASGL